MIHPHFATVVCGLLAVLLSLAGTSGLQAQQTERKVDIQGIDLDGTPFKLSDYRGKVVFLDFWGDW